MTENQDNPRDRPMPEVKAEVVLLEKKFWQDFLDAVSVRTVSLISGVLLIQLAFILSYVGAFHQPTPHRINLAVVAPISVSPRLVNQLNDIHGEPLHATSIADAAVARKRLLHGSTSAALVISPTTKNDSLLVASAGSAATATAVETVITSVETAEHRTVTVTDLLPAQSGDARGLSGFYLVIGWLVGGYLVAALLGVATGARPANGRRAVFRLFAVIPYAILSGLGGAIIVGPALGALTGHLLALWALGTLLVFCAAAVTMALQVLFGVLGIGVTVLLFVVLGNPSAGGAYPPALLPPFWRAISSALPNGAGVQAVRRIVYFGGRGIAGNLLLIALYAALGGAVAFIGARTLSSRSRATTAEAASATSPSPASGPS